MQLKVSITKTIPIRINSNSCLVKMEYAPKVAPRHREPVSPIKTLALLVLNVKKPNSDPIMTNANKAMSSYPKSQSVFHEIIANVKNDISDNPPANPSKPSVKLTALEDAVKINKIISPYIQPIFCLIFKVCTHINGSLPDFIKR